RNVLSVSWGDVGSIAFYPLYHEHRESIVHLAREYSRVLVSFPDADHLRIEQIEPASATRRGSRLRAGVETVTLPLNTTDSAPQVRLSRDPAPARARPQRRLAHDRPPLGHRTLRGRDRAGRRPRARRRHPRAALARELAGLTPTRGRAGPRLRSPLDTWLAGPRACARFERRVLGRHLALLRPRDRAWRAIAPNVAGTMALVRAGAPFQIALERRY